MVTMSTNEYLKKLNEVYPYTEKTDVKNKNFKEKIISILENNNISHFDFIDKLYKTILEYNLSYSTTSIERIVFERYKKNKIIDIDLELLKLFVNKNKDWYKKDKNSYLSQFYKDNSNTRNLTYSIKNYITKLPEYCSLQDFENNNNLISITTDNDSVLKKYVKEKYNIELKKGIDIIAKSKNNNIYIIECKLILNVGGSQNHQIEDCINVSKIEKDNIFGLGVIDGLPFFEDYQFKKEHKKEIENNKRIISIVELMRFLNEN